MKKFCIFLVLLFTVTTSLTACTTTLPAVENNKKTIVTTFFPYYVFTKNLAGDYFNVEMLISNQAEPHDYQFKPSDLGLLKKASLIVKNGLGMDDWVNDAIASAESSAQILSVSTGINLLTPQPVHQLVSASDGHDDEDEHGLYDPHIWVSPQNVLQILPTISAQLINLDATHKAELENLLAVYKEKIQSLDQEIKQKLDPLTDKKFVSFHPATQYFARDYGLQNEASLQSYPGEEPTPYYLKQLTDYIRTQNIHVICTEPQFSPQLVETFARDLQLKVVSFDPLETGIYNANAYQDTMRFNVENLVQALAASS